MPTVSLKAPKLARRKPTKTVLGRTRTLQPQLGKKSGTPPLSLYERCKHLIGVIDGPGDLSANPKYMEGYGRSRSH
jgi:hypothetical protein